MTAHSVLMDITSMELPAKSAVIDVRPAMMLIRLLDLLEVQLMVVMTHVLDVIKDSILMLLLMPLLLLTPILVIYAEIIALKIQLGTMMSLQVIIVCMLE